MEWNQLGVNYRRLEIIYINFSVKQAKGYAKLRDVVIFVEIYATLTIDLTKLK